MNIWPDYRVKREECGQTQEQTFFKTSVRLKRDDVWYLVQVNTSGIGTKGAFDEAYRHFIRIVHNVTRFWVKPEFGEGEYWRLDEDQRDETDPERIKEESMWPR